MQAVDADELKRAFQLGLDAKNGWIESMPVSGQRQFQFPWAIGNARWGELWQSLGAAEFQDALAKLGTFTGGRPLSVVSTRFKPEEAAKAWAEAVTRSVEKETGAPCFNPNEHNVNLAQIKGQDQADRDGRWLLIFMYCVWAAALSGGSLIQLLIPGLGLSPMQIAEAQLAAQCGLPIVRRVLDQKEARAFKLSVDKMDPKLLVEGGMKNAGIDDLIAKLSSGDEMGKEEAAGALRNLAINADNKVAIAKAGGIEPLVALARDGTAGAKEHAAGALRSLAVNNEKNKNMINSAGFRV